LDRRSAGQSVAEIIPFPMPAARRSTAPTAPTPDLARLDRGMATLPAVLAEQRAVVAAWRGALATLQNSTGRLRALSTQCGSSPESLRAQLDGLNAQAHRLERWADTVIAEAAG
jgi:hypothetical protein